MAVGAEYPVPLAQQPEFCEPYSSTFEAATEFLAIHADKTPWLRVVRQEARTQAEATVERRRQQLIDGHFEEAILDVDALGTAAKTAAIKETYGAESGEYQAARGELLLDCERKLAEAYRKNGWEYFEPTTQVYDSTTDQLYTGGLSVDEMVENGLTPLAETEEIERRINDHVRVQTHKEIIKHPASKDMAAIHVSPCTQWAIDAYERDVKKNKFTSAYGGYAPEVRKQMLNYDSFEDGVVLHEQLGVSGEYITDEVIVETFRVLHIIPDSNIELDKTAIHNTTGIVSKQQITGVIDVLRVADQIATEKSGKNIFIGEVVEDDHPKDYSIIPLEAQARKEQRLGQAEELAEYVEELLEKNTDHALATLMVEDYINQKLLHVAEADPEQAEMIFNKATADGFRQVHSLRLQGMYQEAEILRTQVQELAPPAGSCGAGSCGLVGVDRNSHEGKDLAYKLGARSDEKIVKDTVRACPGCGAKAIVYAYNSSSVKKYCGSCHKKA